MIEKLPTSGSVRAVYFSLGNTPSKDPQLNCAKAICDLYSASDESVFVSLYSFTEPSIVEAVIAAEKRNVEQTIIIDHMQAQGKANVKVKNMLVDAGVTVIEAVKQKAAMHNKVGIFDMKTVATGSYNWTSNASCHNDENLIVLDGAEIAQVYKKYVIDRILENETLIWKKE